MSKLKSMTAYARYAQSVDRYECVWELRSVNHRYLDAHIRLPESVQTLEQKTRESVSTYLTRGRVDITLSIKQGVDEESIRSIDPQKLEKWLHWQQQVLAIIPDAKPLSVMQVLSDADLFDKADSEQAVPEEGLLASLDTALQGLLEQRLAEGGRMYAVLSEKLEAIAVIVAALKSNMAEYEAAHQANWQARVEKLTEGEMDPVRLHQELALLISKADVTEEIDRLDSHVEEFTIAMQSDKPVGRRLDFLLQEFNREANTLGSKSIHQEITNASVELKVLIDQLREQVQNIE